MRRAQLLLVSLAHFCVDSYATMLAPVLPLVIDRLGLSLASAGILGTIVSACNLSQPLLGMWADRMRRRWLVIGGLGLAAIFTPLMGIAPSYYTLVAALTIGGFGVAAFHPQVFSLAGELSGDRRAFGIALFIFGGTLGLGVTPLWMPFYAERIGLEFLPVVTIPGLIFLFLVWRWIPLDNPHLADDAPAQQVSGLSDVAGGLAIIVAVVVLRSVTGLGFGFFLAVLSKEQGMGTAAIGIPLAVYNISGVVGALLFGYLADQVTPKPLVWGSLALSAPALYAFLHMQGPLSYVALAIGGGLLLSSNSILVALAQELAPQQSGLASSLPLGFSWGLAGLALGPIGWVADRIGIAETLSWLVLLPLVTSLVALFLPRGGGRGGSRKIEGEQQ
ncbi:MAG: MFS transporter [Gemmatimonadetes bacterium]|jgi:FSR family fosmidomycin resistance protein-like MFS transporter|nr:MFS transporter [Gemmatimonadota bacterium]MBT5058217.1 MFS transporter [Gemmatimonadota bacterium]MBT5146878.1 MFS transporter [Gemmatimonadota bacterium]MBT5960160.1 MFS transporter [Gemmatimonadota bacterium]MBT6631166.1 MFS transporter [Gemmatimonadota bacterium]